MLIFLQENVLDANELGVIGFNKGEIKYLCLFDIHLDVNGICGYTDMGSFYDMRIIESKSGLGDFMIEVGLNKFYPKWMTFDREVNINDYVLKNISKLYERQDVEKKQISKKSEWYREYGDEHKEFLVNHFFRLKSYTLDVDILREKGNSIIKYQSKIPERKQILLHLYNQAIEGKIRQ